MKKVPLFTINHDAIKSPEIAAKIALVNELLGYGQARAHGETIDCLCFALPDYKEISVLKHHKCVPMTISEAKRLILDTFRPMRRIIRRRVRNLGISFEDSARTMAEDFHYRRTLKSRWAK